MGNSHAGHAKSSKQVVTVLQSDGRVLEFSRSLRVADLLNDHPEHFVCHSSALLLVQQGKMLPQNAQLMRGEVYFLLPVPKIDSEIELSKNQKIGEPLTTQQQEPREEAKPAGTMKFLITKQQLAKILAEGSIKVAPKAPELVSLLPESNVPARSSTMRIHRPSPTLVKRSVSWSPGLESISEVPVM